MIGICDVSVQAANPNMPLYPLRAFVNSPSSLRIRNVPKRIGDWNISSVQLVVTYPDNTVKTVECKLIGNVWVGTVAGSSVTGKCENGYTVFASGNDENGNPVLNYTLGKGLVEILEADTELKPGADIKYVRIFDEEPETPKDGDVWQTNGAWYIYQDGQSWPIGDDSGLIGQLSAELSTKLAITDFNDFKTNEFTPEIQYLSGQLDATNGNVTSAQQDIESLSTSKQDTLTPAQLSAVDSVVDERATIFDFGNGDISAFNLVGEITQQTMIDLGLYEPYDWIKPPVSVKVGTSVTNIGSYLFANFPSDFSITLPNTLTAIGDGAFQHVGCLNSIEIPDSVTTMGRAVLFNCSALTDVKIGSSLSSIARNCFERCSSLSTTNIPNNIKTIEIYAFYNSGLTGITIPDSVTNIEHNAFSYCYNLQNVFVGASVNDIGLSAFNSCESLSSVVFKGKTLDEVQAMQNYPWGIPSNKLGIISTENIATQEWVNTAIKFNYTLSTLTPTEVSPFIPASIFPIEFVSDGETTTITNQSEVYLEQQGDPIQAWDLLWHDGNVSYITLATCRPNGIYVGHSNEINSITFGGEEPVAETTQLIMFSKNYTLNDRAINTISVEPASYMCNLVFPDLITGHARDFIVNTVASAGTYSTPPTLSASGVTLMNAEGTMPEIATDENAATTTLVYFSEIAPNTFLVKGETLETIS